MHVLMLSWEYPPRVVGGVAPHVRHLSRALVRAGHRVTVLAGDHPDAPETADDDGVHVRRIAVPYPQPPDFPTEVMQFNLCLVQEAVARFGDDVPFDIIHCHDWLVGPAGRSLKHLWRRPLLATIHATEYGRNGGLHNPLQHYISGMEWWLAYEAWRLITCSRYMRDEVSRVFGVPPAKIDVIPNGVDATEFRLGPRERELLRDVRSRWHRGEWPIIVFLGRLVWEKGVQDLIDALPIVQLRFPQARLIVAGEGPLRSELARRAAERGLASSVYFSGFVSGLQRNLLLGLADVAVFPSRYEPFGIVALEAMAAGVPVVATDTGGLGEIIRHGHNGWKAAPGDPASLARAVIAVLSDGERARKLVEEGTKDIARRFDWSAIATETARVCQRIIEEHQHWSQVAVSAVQVGAAPSTALPRVSYRLSARSSRYRATASPFPSGAAWEPLK